MFSDTHFHFGYLHEQFGAKDASRIFSDIECAKDAGYTQLELNVVAENERAVSLYKKMGFVEYGRNPRGFNSRVSGYQEVVYMLLEL